MSSLVDALSAAAASDKGMTTGVGSAAVRTTWGEIHGVATRGAGVLTAAGVRAGDAVAILAGFPVDVAPAAQAVWLAGGSVTMLHQPTARTDLTRYAADTLAVLRVIDATAVIVGEPFTDAADMLRGAGVLAITVDEIRAGGVPGDPADAPEDSAALLQLTSGSTATPKAVRITHANLWASVTAMATAADLDLQHDVMVSWLPLFHDMGMVGFLTVPMCRGIELVSVTPADFLASPLRWLELISEQRATVTAAPNFAYALAARVLARADGLDLTSLRFALNGAEPVDVAAVRSFLAAGARFGLAETVVVPAYGMAEATLGVSFHPWGTPLAVDTIDSEALETGGRAEPVVPDVATDAGAQPLSSGARREIPLLGPPLPGIEVQVRGADGTACGPRDVGEIFIRGDAVTERFLTVDGPVSTRGADGWLDTGDLGYLTESGAVAVTGRAKDVIIMGGRNLYPTDIERAAQTVAGVRAGNAAAVRLDAGQRRESFAVIVESRQAGEPAEAARIERDVRSVVTAQIGARPGLVLVVPPGTLPKTPSGKIKRAAAIALLAG